MSMTPRQEKQARKRAGTLLHAKVYSLYCRYAAKAPRKPKDNFGWYNLYLGCKKLKGEDYVYYNEYLHYETVLRTYMIGYVTLKDDPQHKKAKADKKLNEKAFYLSWEWKKLRMESLKLHGRRCLCCGFIPNSTSKNYLVVDHIKPVSKFPELKLDIQNTQVLCNDCNMGKSNIHLDDYRE